jgi:hypothetical protein
MQLADDSLSDDEKKRLYDEHVKRMIDLNTENLVRYTDSIVTEDGEDVRDSEFIKEFYANTAGANLKKLQERIAEDSKLVNIRPMDAECKACDQQFKIEVTFDYASFFAIGS